MTVRFLRQILPSIESMWFDRVRSVTLVLVARRSCDPLDLCSAGTRRHRTVTLRVSAGRYCRLASRVVGGAGTTTGSRRIGTGDSGRGKLGGGHTRVSDQTRKAGVRHADPRRGSGTSSIRREQTADACRCRRSRPAHPQVHQPAPRSSPTCRLSAPCPRMRIKLAAWRVALRSHIRQQSGPPCSSVASRWPLLDRCRSSMRSVGRDPNRGPPMAR
jgi:hypothetical protein